MWPDNRRLNEVAVLDRSQHSEKDRMIQSLPHDMVLVSFGVNLLTRRRSDIHKRTKLLKLHCTEDRPMERQNNGLNVWNKKKDTKHALGSGTLEEIERSSDKFNRGGGSVLVDTQQMRRTGCRSIRNVIRN